MTSHFGPNINVNMLINSPTVDGLESDTVLYIAMQPVDTHNMKPMQSMCKLLYAVFDLLMYVVSVERCILIDFLFLVTEGLQYGECRFCTMIACKWTVN